MNYKKLNQILTFIIYVLTICLIFLIIYNAFLLFKGNYFSANPPKNSIKVGPISIDCLKNMSIN